MFLYFLTKNKLIFVLKKKDIQEFYELILLDDSKDVNTKALAVLKIAEKWSENNIQGNNNNNNNINDLIIDTNNGGYLKKSSSDIYEKSPKIPTEVFR